MRRLIPVALAVSYCLQNGICLASEPFTLAIRGHKLVPDKLVIPHGERVELTVTNEGPGPEEIESRSLRLEKIIPEGKSVTVKIGPLKAGTYDIFGDFHADTCVGAVVVQ